MSAVNKLLDRLAGVKGTGPDRWIARCPAHPDKRPSLSIRDVGGKILLHDFAGCETADVLAALGLELADLFDRPIQHYTAGTKSSIPARDLLEIIDQEALEIGILALQFRKSRSLTDEQWSRLATAAARIGRARDHAHVR